MFKNNIETLTTHISMRKKYQWSKITYQNTNLPSMIPFASLSFHSVELVNLLQFSDSALSLGSYSHTDTYTDEFALRDSTELRTLDRLGPGPGYSRCYPRLPLQTLLRLPTTLLRCTRSARSSAAYPKLANGFFNIALATEENMFVLLEELLAV